MYFHSRDDHTLVTLLPAHEVVGIVCNGKDMWRLLSYPLASVAHDVLLVIDGQHLVWVDGHKDGTSVGL